MMALEHTWSPEYQPASSDNTYRLLVGVLFVTAFFTLHINVIPALPGEYQPVLFFLLAALLFVNHFRHLPYFPVVAVLACLTVAFVINAFLGRVDLWTLVRCVVGPLFALVGAALIKDAPLGAFRAVLYGHAVFIVVAILAPDLLGTLTEETGFRGGLTGFLASEPSYAALNLAGVFALWSLRDARVISSKDGLLCIFALLFTQSVTGVFFAALFLLQFISAKELPASKAIALCVVVFLAGFVFPNLENYEESDYLTEKFLNTLNLLGRGASEGDLYTFLEINTSASWRVLTNVVASTGLLHAPFGTGTAEVDYLLSNFTLPPSITALMYRNEVFYSLERGVVAATPVFNYITFGGFIAFVPLAVFLYFSMQRIARNAPTKTVAVVCLSYLLVGALWQTALTSPTWWFLLGAGFWYLPSQAHVPRRAP